MAVPTSEDGPDDISVIHAPIETPAAAPDPVDDPAQAFVADPARAYVSEPAARYLGAPAPAQRTTADAAAQTVLVPLEE